MYCRSKYTLSSLARAHIHLRFKKHQFKAVALAEDTQPLISAILLLIDTGSFGCLVSHLSQFDPL